MSRMLIALLPALLCSRHALAEPPLLIGAADLVRVDGAGDRVATVIVDELAARPMPGRYLLVDTTGVLAALVLEPTRTRSRGCLHHVELTPAAPISTAATPTAHRVVIGPLPDTARPPARLLRWGLALTGQAAGEPEPLGSALPGGAKGDYAVDLDGDGRGDLVLTREKRDRSVAQGMMEASSTLRLSRRSGSRWRAITRCESRKLVPID